jgi:hypothetical protein
MNVFEFVDGVIVGTGALWCVQKSKMVQKSVKNDYRLPI